MIEMRLKWAIVAGGLVLIVFVSWKIAMAKRKKRELFIATSFINSFHYLCQDADFFRGLAARAEGFERVRYCRTAVLLYVFSLEALINRCMDHFLPDDKREFFLEKERNLSTLDKFQLVPLLVTGKNFDKANDPLWARMRNLFRLRDDFVHPKHDRVAYMKVVSKKEFDHLQVPEIPSDSEIKPKDIEYPSLKVPTDPYAFLPEHLDRVRDVTGDILQKLDELLDGRVLKESWHTQDKFHLFYPSGAEWKDLPGTFAEHLPREGKELRGGWTEKS